METENHVLFFGHTNLFGELSNFYPCEFIDNGVKYNCTEQYFMKKKQETFDPTNTILAKKIMESTNPLSIKKYGKQVKNFDEETWKKIRANVMFDGNFLKYTQNENLKKLLLSTNNKILVEASPYDKIWGAGMNAQKIIDCNYKFKGQNLLGAVLMEVRKQIK